MIWLIALLLIALLVWWAEAHYRRWKEKRAVDLAKCAEHGHDEGPVEFAFDAWQFPFRRCKRCGNQRHLSECIVCGRRVDRDTRRLEDGQDGCGDGPGTDS